MTLTTSRTKLTTYSKRIGSGAVHLHFCFEYNLMVSYRILNDCCVEQPENLTIGSREPAHLRLYPCVAYSIPNTDIFFNKEKVKILNT